MIAMDVNQIHKQCYCKNSHILHSFVKLGKVKPRAVLLEKSIFTTHQLIFFHGDLFFTFAREVLVSVLVR